MTRHCFIFATWLLLVEPTFAAEIARPNVLFIAVDDLRTELGCYGNTHIKSPHIDALAAQSVLFNRAYCQQAVCNPSRASLLTGLRPDSAKVWDLVTHFRDTVPDVVTLPQHFRKHGYYSVAYGKIFHNPLPDDRSWNEPNHWPKQARVWSEGGLQRLQAYREQMRSTGKSEAAIHRMRAPATEDEDVADSVRPDGEIADQAIDAMRRLSSKDTPFFLAVGFINPHLPFNAPRRYWDLYDPTEIPVAANPKLPDGAPAMAMNTMYELRDYMDFADTSPPSQAALSEAQQRRLKHGYYAAVSFIDAQVGRVLAELDRLKLRENTIIVLWGDHGWKLGEHRSWCKQTNYEVDTHVPLLIHMPGDDRRNPQCESVVEFVDVYPTLCELAGLPVPDHLQGTSLVPLLRNPNQTGKNVAFSQFPRRHAGREVMGYAMRTDRFRYVEWLDRGNCETVAIELYDHEHDPQENVNIGGDLAQQAKVAELSATMWKAIPRPQPGDLATPDPPRPVVRFKNDRREAVELFWLAPDGRRVSQGRVAPGKVRVIKTTLSHRFQVGGEQENVVTVTKQDETITIGKESPDRSGAAPKRPNILVLMGDDWSWPHAGFLGDNVVQTPTFDRLAREGVIFEQAFVSSPSCTPSRFAIASGQWHWRLGEAADLGGSLAKDVPVYPDLLSTAGYHVGYTRKGAAPSKHIYRGIDPFGPRFDSFDEFLKQRDSGKPFCFWYGAGEPHRPYRSGVGVKQGLKPDAVQIPACLPDNDVVRSDLCDYYEAVARFDRAAERMLKLLEEAGELNNTVIVVSGDNGMPFPRCKATLYDTGTRVPLVIYWPQGAVGKRRVQDLVSLTDLAPTFLEAAGVAIPDSMTGRSLLPILKSQETGQVDPKRSHVLTGVEKHVYAYPSRAIRTKDFLYIRNFQPEAWPSGESRQPSPPIDFTDGSWPSFPGAFSFNIDPSPTKQYLLEHRAEGKSKHLFALACGQRLEEELYDLGKDPQQLHNVGGDAAYSEQLEGLRTRLEAALRESGDPRFVAKQDEP